MRLFGKTKIKRLQLYHYDNGDLEFIKRDIVGESATEFDNAGEPLGSWWDPYATLYPFDGYKNISADAVQIAYGRHFHLEIHDILSDEQRPPNEDSMDTPWITAIAEARCVEITKAAKPKTIYEILTKILGGALIIEMLIWGIGYAT